MRSEIPGDSSRQEPSRMESDHASLVEQMIGPIVIFNKQGKLCFMNPAARKLLAGNLAARLTAHLHSESSRRAVMKVRFPLDNGKKIVLKITRKRIEWEGQRAVLISLHDVTRYIAAIEESRTSFDKESQRIANECEQLRLQLRESKQACESVKAQYTESENLKEQLQQEQSRREAAEVKNHELSRNIAQLTQAFEQLQADHTHLEKAARAHAAEVADLKEALEQQRTEATELVGDAMPSEENIIAAAMRKAWAVRGQSASTDA